MTKGTEVTIHLDRLHQVHRSGNRWALRRQTINGMDLLEAWNGTLSTLRRRLDERGIVPSRAAEELLRNLSEDTGFRDRSDVTV